MIIGIFLILILCFSIVIPSILIILPYITYILGILFVLGTATITHGIIPGKKELGTKLSFLVNALSGFLVVAMLFKLGEFIAVGIMLVWAGHMAMMCISLWALNK